MLMRNTVLLTIILTFLLINLGGFVHNTGSSLACPDWPLCFGQVMPKMEGGVMIEHGHRMLGSLVGIFTVAIVFLARRSRNKNFIQLSYLALSMVILQGTLGGLTVILKLSPLVSTAHLALSLLFLCTLIYFHHQLGPNKIFKLLKNKLLMLSLVLAYLQILLGAFIRHFGLGSVCGVGSENSLQCFNPITGLLHWFPESIEMQLHMAHRYLGANLGIVILVLSISLLKLAPKMGLWLSSLVVLQIFLGILTISSGMQPITTMLHLSFATLLLASLWKLRLSGSLSV